MKIAAISASQIPSSAANSLQAMKAVHALAQLGHQVTLIAPAAGSPQPWESLASLYGLQTPFEIEYLPAASRRLFVLAAARRAHALRPNLLYTWPLQAAALGQLLGLPVILEMHDLPGGRVGPLWYRYFRDARGSKRLVLITKALREALTQRFGAFGNPSQVLVAPNGVDVERFRGLPSPAEARLKLGWPEAPTVVCAGHLYAGRGVELFFGLAQALPGARFVWVGGKPEAVEQARQQVQLQRLSNLTFTGFIPNAQLPLHLAAADALTMPYGREIGISSGPGHSAQVSSPMKMFEYLAAGRAILSSDLPVFHEALTPQNAVFCPPEDLPTWQRALTELLNDAPRRAALGAQAAQDALTYDWKARAGRILAGFDV